MSNAPLMPMATAVWLVENTTLTFKQIANFCNMHEVEIQGIADGEVAKGIKAYNPIIAGQLSKEEIELSSNDESRPLKIKNTDVEIGSYPFFKAGKLGVAIVLRSTDKNKIEFCKSEIIKFVKDKEIQIV